MVKMDWELMRSLSPKVLAQLMMSFQRGDTLDRVRFFSERGGPSRCYNGPDP